MRPIEAAYDKWWASVQPQLVNEKAAATPKEMTFKVLYEQQFGKKPDEPKK